MVDYSNATVVRAASLPVSLSGITALGLCGSILVAGLASGVCMVWQLQNMDASIRMPAVIGRPISILGNASDSAITCVAVSEEADIVVVGSQHNIWV